MVREFAESATCCGARVRLRVHVGPGDRKTRWERYVQSSQYRWYSHTAGRDPFLWGAKCRATVLHHIRISDLICLGRETELPHSQGLLYKPLSAAISGLRRSRCG